MSYNIYCTTSYLRDVISLCPKTAYAYFKQAAYIMYKVVFINEFTVYLLFKVQIQWAATTLWVILLYKANIAVFMKDDKIIKHQMLLTCPFKQFRRKHHNRSLFAYEY